MKATAFLTAAMQVSWAGYSSYTGDGVSGQDRPSENGSFIVPSWTTVSDVEGTLIHQWLAAAHSGANMGQASDPIPRVQ